MSRRKRNLNESTRGRAFAISIIGGLTLLALAATVFAVASQARSVSAQAEQSVQVTENLRAVSIARANLSIASRVAAVGPDQTEVLLTTLANADEALDEVEDNFDERTPSEVRTVFSDYRTAASSQSELILSGTATPEASLEAELATGTAFEALAIALRSERDAQLDGLRADNDLMNLISTIATFVVAFVVPSAALYIFEALRRTPRRARQLEHAYENTTATSLAMAAAVSKEASNLRKAIDRLPGEHHDHELLRSALRFEHVAALNGSVRALHNVEVDLRELALEVTRSIGHPVAISDSGAESAVVHGDNEQISLLMAELLQNAVTHGEMPVELEIQAEENQVIVTVSDQGPGLPEVIEDAIIHDNDYATRGNLLSGTYGFGLLAAREATESLGGQLRYHRQDGETSLIVELPKSHFATQVKPTDISLPAALEGRSAA